MRDRFIEFFVIAPLGAMLAFLRLVFLSSHLGALGHNLIYLGLFRISATTEEHRKLSAGLQMTLRGNHPLIEWQRRVYLSAPKTVHHALQNVFIRRFIIGGMRRRQLAKQGYTVPSVVMISLNTPEAGCNLACKTCYATGHNNTTMPPALLHRIVAEQEQLGIYHVRLLGGEPFLYKGLWQVFEAFPHTSFYVATNGTLINRKAATRLANLGNVFPMISLEGFEATTDAIRGTGVFRQVLSAMENCQQARLPFSITTTVTKANLKEVTSPAFLGFLDSKRTCAVAYSCYVAIGRSARQDWQLSIHESEELDRVSDLIHGQYALYSTVGRNGIDRVNDCSAAREFFHILPDGQVESCPFAQWANPDLNIRDHSILEIMASPFFAGIRELNSYGIVGAAPCKAPSLSSLRTAFTQLGAQPTSPQPERTHP